ncbi:Csp1 family four helix bundle copper storage protein [Stagnimonas aquatica]|uniref:Csp1 family four helix bundle copper storage protein n=1 Tax=Stagnimonas aquatica TaxID=2689987 RepID=A0A3N0VH85_9GAMM|nr:Csp1 family four helix bundle copper storage protein [Stagnimonas aquatica]ROH92041.1 Csp1 family four helix bundle copper storage protein [Stagnimonas aquatica]
MQRRDFTLGLFAAAATASSLAHAGKEKVSKPAAADHPGHHGVGAGTGRYAALAQAFASCAGTATECVSHCQRLLAEGDTMMGDCLKTSLACDAICPAVARLARLESDQAPVFAKAAIPAMQACMDACKPHIEHHAFCKACFEACGAAVAAAQAV